MGPKIRSAAWTLVLTRSSMVGAGGRSTVGWIVARTTGGAARSGIAPMMASKGRPICAGNGDIGPAKSGRSAICAISLGTLVGGRRISENDKEVALLGRMTLATGGGGGHGPRLPGAGLRVDERLLEHECSPSVFGSAAVFSVDSKKGSCCCFRWCRRRVLAISSGGSGPVLGGVTNAEHSHFGVENFVNHDVGPGWKDQFAGRPQPDYEPECDSQRRQSHPRR